MGCLLLLPLVALLGSAHAGPFFRLKWGPEHRSGPEGGVELPPEPLLAQEGPEPFPQEVPEESGAVFALQLPKIDLSDLFRPLRVFAGVNVDHASAIAARQEEPNCDQQRFELTDDEFDIVMDCQELVGGDEVELKECILTKLPETNAELRAFLDREEFGVAGLSSSVHLSLRNGEFTQKRSVQFRLCPRDEVNTIDGEPLVPVVLEEAPVVVQEMVPVETLSPDRVDVSEPELAVGEPEAAPPRPLFELPEIKLPDFGQIFSQALAPVFGPPPAAQTPNLGLFGSQLNPFAVRPPPAATGPQHGFFGALFPEIAATPPPQGHPDGIDTSDCTSQQFEVSRFVFNVANRCQYANDYRKCLRLDLADDASASELLSFAADPDFSVVASSFSSFQTTFDLEALTSGKGLLDLKRKNLIDLRRCANIAPEQPTEPAAEVTPETAELTPETAELTPEVTPEAAELTPEVTPEVTPETAEVTPEVTLEAATEEVLTESPAEVAPGAEVAPEVAPEVFPEVAPEVTPEVAEVAPEVVAEVTPEATTDVTPEVFEAAPQAPAEPAGDAAKAAAESEKAAGDAAVPEETQKAVREAEKAAGEPQPVESEGGAQRDAGYDVVEP